MPRQVLAVRELRFEVHSFTADGNGLFGWSGGELRLLSLKTGWTETVATDVSWFEEAPALAGPGRPAPILAHHNARTPSGARRLTVFHRDTSVRQAIEGFSFVVLDGRMAVVRSPASGGNLWVGPPEALVPVPVALAEVAAIAQPLVPGRKLLALGRAASGEAAAIYELDLDSGAASLVAPARPGPASGQPAALPPRPVFGAGELVGAIGFVRACWREEEDPRVGPPRCLLAIERGTGKSVEEPFFGPGGVRNQVSANFVGTYVARPDGSGEVYLGPALNLRAALGGPVLGWQRADAVDLFASWNLASDLVKECQVGSSRGVLESRQRGFALLELQPGKDRLLAVEADGPQSCVLIGAGHGAETFAFSPGSRALAWSSTTHELRGNISHAVGRLWVANGAGGEARSLAQGPILEPIAFLDESRLLYRQHSPDGAGLGWLDVNEQPVRERPLVQHVMGEPHVVSRRWVLQIADQRAQDGTGTLALVDVDSGHSWAIASGVSRLFGQPNPNLADEAATISAVYQVRQPAASPDDGLWLLRLRPSDLP